MAKTWYALRTKDHQQEDQGLWDTKMVTVKAGESFAFQSKSARDAFIHRLNRLYPGCYEVTDTPTKRLSETYRNFSADSFTE